MGCWGALANYSFVSASVFPQLAEFYLIQTEIQSKRKLIWTISVDCKSEIVWNMFKKKKDDIILLLCVDSCKNC